MKVPVKVYEEVKGDDIAKVPRTQLFYMNNYGYCPEVEWLDKNGIDTPYIVTTINGTELK
jgi:inorganic pyrophosphatase